MCGLGCGFLALLHNEFYDLDARGREGGEENDGAGRGHSISWSRKRVFLSSLNNLKRERETQACRY